MKASEKLKLQIRREKEKRKKQREKLLERQKQQKLKEDLKLAKKPLNIGRSVWTKEGIKDVFRVKEKSKLLIINMELNNGHHDTFFVTETEDSFKHKGKRYIFDPKMKYYNVGLKEFGYDYHEGFPLPIKREFPLNATKTAIESAGTIETEYATNPSTLERFMNSSIIEMMLRGGTIDKLIRILIIIAGIGLAIALIHMILYMYQSGLFENLGI